MRPYPWVTGNRRFAIVATDGSLVIGGFTKWVKAEALAKISDVDMKKFVYENIITRFKIPVTLISDNGL